VPRKNNQGAERHGPDDAMQEYFRRRNRADEDEIDRQETPEQVTNQRRNETIASIISCLR